MGAGRLLERVEGGALFPVTATGPLSERIKQHKAATPSIRLRLCFLPLAPTQDAFLAHMTLRTFYVGI